MSAQKGRDLLIKIKDISDVYKTVIGLRTKSFNLNAKLIDISTSDSANAWRELLPGAGIKTLEVSGSGIFNDAESDALMRQAFFDQSAQDLQLIIPDFGQIKGLFLVSALSYSGSYSGEASYEVSLVSASEMMFSAL